MEPLHSKIARLIKLKNISQSKLARECGVSRPTINRYLNGKNEIRSKDLVKILGILEIDVEALVNEQIINEDYKSLTDKEALDRVEQALVAL